MNLAESNFSKKYFLDEISLRNFEKEDLNGKILLFDRVFRRHHVNNDPINFVDPSGKIFGLDDAVVGVIAIVALPAIAQGTSSAITTYAQTGSFSQAASAFTSGATSGALAGATALGVLAFGAETAAAVGLATAIDVGYTFATAPGVLSNGGISDFANGINAINGKGMPHNQCP